MAWFRFAKLLYWRRYLVPLSGALLSVGDGKFIAKLLSGGVEAVQTTALADGWEFAYALENFDAQESVEVSLRHGERYAVGPRGKKPEWRLVRVGDKIGWAPSEFFGTKSELRAEFTDTSSVVSPAGQTDDGPAGQTADGPAGQSRWPGLADDRTKRRRAFLARCKRDKETARISRDFFLANFQDRLEPPVGFVDRSFDSDFREKEHYDLILIDAANIVKGDGSWRSLESAVRFFRHVFSVRKESWRGGAARDLEIKLIFMPHEEQKCDIYLVREMQYMRNLVHVCLGNGGNCRVEELDDLEAIFLAQIHEQKYKNGSALIVSNDHFKYHCSLEFHTTYVLQYAISPCGAHFSPCKHALFPSGCYPLSRRTYVFYGDFDEEI